MSRKNNTMYPDSVWERMVEEEERLEEAIAEIAQRKEHPPKITKSNKKDYWLSPQGLELMRHYARNGYNQSEIADLIGVDKSAITRWKKAFPPLENILNESAEVATARVENAMYDLAEGSNPNADFRAAQFILINRGENWHDIREIKHDVEADIDSQVVIVDDLKALDIEEETEDVEKEEN